MLYRSGDGARAGGIMRNARVAEKNKVTALCRALYHSRVNPKISRELRHDRDYESEIRYASTGNVAEIRHETGRALTKKLEKTLAQERE